MSRGALLRLLRHRHAERVALGAALLLMLPGLGGGLLADDLVHRVMLDHGQELPGFERHPLDLFHFYGPEHQQRLRDDGHMSWWADPEATLRFFRPLSAATHLLDHVLWPDTPWLAHLHSWLWAAALFGALLLLYRELIPAPYIATLALALFALDDARGWLVSWIAGRNTVIAAALGLLALWLHHRWRVRRDVRAAWLAPPLLLLALLAAEGAIAVCGYLLAYAGYVDRAELRARLCSLLPAAAVVLLWLLPYQALGHGVSGSGLYASPLSEPIAFVGQLAVQGPILLLAQLGGPWSDAHNAYFIFPGLGVAALVLAFAVLSLLAWLARPIWRDDTRFRFWVVGAALATLPASVPFPSDRVLPFIAIGACPALATVMAWHLRARFVQTPRLGALVFHGALVACLVLGPLMLPPRALGNRGWADIVHRAERSLPSARELDGRTLIYVNTAAVPLSAYVPLLRVLRGEPVARHQRWLATADSPLSVHRLDARTLSLRPADGYLKASDGILFRSPRRPFRVGAVVRLTGVRFEIVTLTADGRPAEVHARFDRPLEDPQLVWVRWEGRGYSPYRPPAIGQAHVLPAIDYLSLMLGDEDTAAGTTPIARLEPR